jgi:hypothetical protein
MTKLSDTQAVILSAAAQRDDGAVLPLRAHAVDRPQLDAVGERDQPCCLRRSDHRPLQSRHSHLTIAPMAATAIWVTAGTRIRRPRCSVVARS